ncbi:nuclear autoantigenic sperm protein isoform X2 [Haemaphysalis longicornis]
MAEATSPPSKTEGDAAAPKKTEPSVDAAMLLLQGKRHLLVQDYPSAVASLQEACELLGKIYGETAKECGEAYLCYGRALLELARQETGVLGNALESEEEQDDDDDDDDDGEEDKSQEGEEGDAAGAPPQGGSGDEKSEKKEEPKQSGSAAESPSKEQTAVVENAEESKGAVGGSGGEMVATEVKVKDGGAGDKAAGEVEEDVEEDLEKPEPALKDDIEPAPSEPSTSTAGPSGSSAPKDEEEVPNLQLAWEVLELAKIIFQKQAEEGGENSRECRLKVADVLLKLGEISLESDNCEQAVEDLGQCLAIQRELLEPDSRQVAETHYQRGLAFSFGGQYPEAVDDFRAAVRVLELRVENLSRFIEEGSKKERQGSLDEDPVWLAEREVEELKGLLPEVRARVEDTEDTLRQDCRALKDATIQKMRDRVPPPSPVKSSGSGAESSRPVNVITHLIKRKRTSDEGGSQDQSPAATPKKLKPEVVPDTNGESASKTLALDTPATNDHEKTAASPLKTAAS